MSKTPAWAPGGKIGFAAYGGHVYAQAVWAASQTVPEGMIVHNVHGFFTLPGLVDRPFIYKVDDISDGRSYCTRSVVVQQPLEPSIESGLPIALRLNQFNSSHGQKELGKICFTCICSFKKDQEDDVGHQEVKPMDQEYSVVLNGKGPSDHPHAPSVDAPWYHDYAQQFPQPLDFPGLEVHKVDMTAYNNSKSTINYRQLSYYRLIGTISASNPNLHACAHLFASDRNSLFVISNALGIPNRIDQMGSLSHSVVFHVRSEKLLFTEAVHNDAQWFCQEAWTPRSLGGRGIHESKIWDASGLHVASTWQDGLVRRTQRSPADDGEVGSLQRGIAKL